MDAQNYFLEKEKVTRGENMVKAHCVHCMNVIMKP